MENSNNLNVRRNFGSNDSYTNGAPLQKKYALATSSEANEPRKMMPRFEDGKMDPAHARKTSDTFSLKEACFGPHAVNENTALHARSAMPPDGVPDEDDSYSLNDFHQAENRDGGSTARSNHMDSYGIQNVTHKVSLPMLP